MYMNKEQIKKRISFGREYPLVSTWNVICQLIFNKLNVQLQFNFISDDDISGFGYGIPGEAKFFSVDAARNFKSGFGLAILIADRTTMQNIQDRKSTRLNSSHDANSYAVVCLKKKNWDMYLL